MTDKVHDAGKERSLAALPIFKKSYDLCLATKKIIDNFPKLDRRTLGERMFDSSLEMLSIISEICRKYSSSETKVELADDFIRELDLFKNLMKLSHDFKDISDKGMASLSLLTENIGKQIGGWMKTMTEEE